MSDSSFMFYVPKHFIESEFQKCNPACALVDMDPDFLQKLDHLREMCGFPFVLTSAYRSSDWDKKKGRSGYGYHTKGRAVDVYCVDSFKRADILVNAPYCGLNGIGVGKTYVHLDDRIIPTCWVY